MLLVVDDIWERSQFDIVKRATNAHPCLTMLVTTRDNACLPDECKRFGVRRLTESAAVQFLEAYSGELEGERDREAAIEVARLCGCVPVAVYDGV